VCILKRLERVKRVVWPYTNMGSDTLCGFNTAASPNSTGKIESTTWQFVP